MTIKAELKERIQMASDSDFAQQCWNLLFDIENEYWQKAYTFFREARDGRREMNAASLERAQGLLRLAIDDLERLCKVLEIKRELI